MKYYKILMSTRRSERSELWNNEILLGTMYYRKYLKSIFIPQVLQNISFNIIKKDMCTYYKLTTSVVQLCAQWVLDVDVLGSISGKTNLGMNFFRF